MNCTRRNFLGGLSALVVGFSLQRPLAALALERVAPDSGRLADKTLDGEQVDAWLALLEDGRLIIYSGKVELGTGVQTALRQIVAEELCVDFARTEIIQGDTRLTPDQGYTAGSKTIQQGGMQLRRAAATARQALLAEASERLQVPVLQLSCAQGFVVAADGRALAYTSLLQGQGLAGPLAPQPALIDPAAYRLVGRSVPRADIPDKIFGQFTYVQDVRLPGMLHGRVIRPPCTGATRLAVRLRGIDDSRLPAGARVLRLGNFVGVVAEDEWLAQRAAEQLVLDWQVDQRLPAQDALYEHLLSAPAEAQVVQQAGAPERQWASAAKVLEAEYRWPFQNHDSIGPSCAVAQVKDGQATVWSGTQGVYQLRAALADLLGLAEPAVHVIYVEASGCYGHNGADDVAGDAALLAQLAGRPVRVQWSRADEHGWNPKGPAMVMRVKGALDEQGGLTAWQFDNWSTTHSTRPNARGGAGLLLAGQLARGLQMNAGRIGADRNAPVDYVFPHCQVTTHWLALEDSPLRPSALRGLGALQNAFANESFVDELAHAAGVDPLELRLRYVQDPRARAVLQEATRLAGWQSGPMQPPRRWDGAPARGRGLAWLRYENENAYVAAVVEIEASARGVRALQVWVAHDCGLIINPDGLRNQIEGNVVQALSRALKEEVAFGPAGVTSLEWGAYPLINFRELPQVQISLIDRPDAPPVGAGEATSGAIAPAVANALFAATGLRLRQVPLTRERLNAARLAQP